MGKMDKRLQEEWERAVYNAQMQNFKSPSESRKVVSVYKNLKFFSIIGFFLGVFPVNNCCFGSTASELSSRRLSFHYLWSWMTFLVKVVGLLLLLSFLSAILAFEYAKMNIVDTIAWAIVYMITFSFGGYLHVAHTVRTKKVISLLQRIDLYDEKYYYCSRPTRVFSRKVCSCCIASILIIITPCWILFNLQGRIDYYLQSDEPMGKSVVIFIKHGSLTVAVLSMVMILVEYGVTFYYILLFYFGALLKDRLGEIVTYIQYKSVSKGNFGKMQGTRTPYEDGSGGGEMRSRKVACSSNPGINNWNGNGRTVVKLSKDRSSRDDGAWGYHTHKSWLAISQQYLDFHDVHDQYCDFIGFSFIVLFATLTISLVCMVFCYSGAGNEFLENCSKTILGMVVVSFLRILFLADVGELFLKKHAEMLKSLTKVQQSAHFMPPEKSQFKQLFLTATTLPVRLSAMGFFTVSRQNVTSILGVIITYVIVLVQFRSSNEPSVLHGNETTGFTGT